jgi:hypothetical protein
MSLIRSYYVSVLNIALSSEAGALTYCPCISPHTGHAHQSEGPIIKQRGLLTRYRRCNIQDVGFLPQQSCGLLQDPQRLVVQQPTLMVKVSPQKGGIWLHLRR